MVKVGEVLLYCRLCLTRAQSHIGVAGGIMNTVLLVGLVFQNANLSAWYSLVVGALAMLVSLLVGHWDISSGFFQREQSLYNSHNAELMSLVRKGKGRV